MTEQEYIYTTNAAKVNIAYQALAETLITDDDTTTTDKERIKLIRTIYSWREKLMRKMTDQAESQNALLEACKDALELIGDLEYDGEPVRENNYRFLKAAIAQAEKEG